MHQNHLPAIVSATKPLRIAAHRPDVDRYGVFDYSGSVIPIRGPAVGLEEWPHIADGNPARRIGTVEDVANGVLFAMTDTFMTGMTLKIDGGEPLT